MTQAVDAKHSFAKNVQYYLTNVGFACPLFPA